MNPTLLERLARRLEEAPAEARSAGILVACSGGPDSTALLSLLTRHRESRNHVSKLAAASLDHGLRGERGAEDVRFVEETCRRLGISCHTGRVDTAATAETEGLSLEEAARQLRYAFLARTARELGCRLVVTGHTRDDAAETFLMRLLRGAGRTGLCGLRPVRALEDDLVLARPLIDVSRAEILDHLKEEGLGYRVDETNEDLRFERNRLREEILPRLEALRPGAAARLARTSQILAAEECHLREEAREAMTRGMHREGDGLLLERRVLTEAPPALRPRILRRFLVEARGDLRGITSRHLELLGVTHNEGTTVDLPGGWRAHVSPGELRLVPADDGEASPASYCYQGAIPVDLDVPSGWCVRGRRLEEVPPVRELRALPPEVAVLDAARLEERFRIRSRRPGDRIRPLGMGGRSRKLQDLLVDRKVPRDLRDGLPLVEGQAGIAWVAGVAVAEPYRVRRETSEVVRFELRANAMDPR